MKTSFIEDMCYDLIIATLKANAPKKTGNLATFSIRRAEDKVVIGGEIAPYAKYTEENNKSSKGWIQRTIEGLIPVIEAVYKTKITADELEKMIEAQNLIYQNDIDELVKKEKEKLQNIQSKKEVK